jgi:hypothetical protein
MIASIVWTVGVVLWGLVVAPFSVPRRSGKP